MANKSRKGGFGFSTSSLTGPGTAFTLGFIALAIGMGLLLSRGVTPRSTLSDPGETGDVELIIETPAPNQQGLQLKTLKFRECGSKAAVGLLVDRSGSMRGKKIIDLRDALTSFTGGMSNQSVVGLSSFSSNDGSVAFREDVAFSRYVDVKAQLTTAIARLEAAGATNTRTAFENIKVKILAAKNDPQFADQQFALIFLSDGIPEAVPADCASGRIYPKPTGRRCFANSQDPTQNGDIPKEIKDAGIKIFSIAIYDADSLEDNYFLPFMREMMKKIASDDTSYYETPDTGKLKEIYKSIAQRICKDAQ